MPRGAPDFYLSTATDIVAQSAEYLTSRIITGTRFVSAGYVTVPAGSDVVLVDIQAKGVILAVWVGWQGIEPAGDCEVKFSFDNAPFESLKASFLKDHDLTGFTVGQSGLSMYDDTNYKYGIFTSKSATFQERFQGGFNNPLSTDVTVFLKVAYGLFG